MSGRRVLDRCFRRIAVVGSSRRQTDRLDAGGYVGFDDGSRSRGRFDLRRRAKCAISALLIWSKLYIYRW